jgi:carbon storage regulator CsrA
MLVLSRKAGEEIELDLGGHRVVMRVMEIRPDKVRLSFDADRSVAIDRAEVAASKRASMVERKQKPAKRPA